MHRRTFLTRLVAGTLAGGAAIGPTQAIDPFRRTAPPRLKLSCAAYSFRQFLTAQQNPMTLEGFLDLCAGWGLDGVELTSYYFPSTEPSYLARLKRQAFLLGLDVSGTAVRNDFCQPAGEGRQRDIKHVKRWVDIAAALGAPCIRVFAGSVPPGDTEAGTRQRVVEALEECCAYAGERGICLALENHGGITTTPDSLLEIVKAVQSPWFGVNLDTGNFHGDDPYTDLARLAPYAVTVQVKTEITPRGGPRQEVDASRLIALLREAGYRGYLALEYEAAEDPHIAVPRWLTRLREAMAGQTQ